MSESSASKTWTWPKAKAVWYWVENISVLFAGAFSVFTAVSPQVDKPAFAPFTLGFLVLVLVAKGIGKWLEDRDKRAKEAKDHQIQGNHIAELQSIRADYEVDTTRRAEELAVLIARYDAVTKRVLIGILREFHEKYFNKEREEKFRHRTTLFKCIEVNGPDGPGKELRIFARVGLNQDSTRGWPIDDNDPKKCRGIAGLIWINESSSTAYAKGPWPEEDDPIGRELYAHGLGMTVDEAAALHVKSMAFTGLLIKVRGRKWGVILLDSAKPEHIPQGKSSKDRLVAQYAGLISSVLNEVES